MIARVWRGVAGFETADTYIQHLEKQVFPELSEIHGFLSAEVMRRNLQDHVEFLVITKWQSMHVIKDFAGDDIEKAVVQPEAQVLLKEYDRTVKHFEIVS